jgi:hypothetical protein
MLWQFWPFPAPFSNNQWPSFEDFMPFIFDGQYADIRWVIDNINLAPNEVKANFELFPSKANAAYLVYNAFLTV